MKIISLAKEILIHLFLFVFSFFGGLGLEFRASLEKQVFYLLL
jgi:hypothetical protein